MGRYGNEAMWTGRKAAPKAAGFQPHFAVNDPFTVLKSITRLTHSVFVGTVTVLDDSSRDYRVVLYKEHVQAVAIAAGLDALPSYAGATLLLDAPLDVKLRRWDSRTQQYKGITAIRDQHAVMVGIDDWVQRAAVASQPIERTEPVPVTLDTLREVCYTPGFMQDMTCSIYYPALSHKIVIYCKPMTADERQRYIDTLGAHMDKYEIEIIAQVKKPRFTGGL